MAELNDLRGNWTKLYNLKRNDLFRIEAHPHPLRFLKVDGMYAHVQSTDEATNQQMASRFSADCDYFVISAAIEVEVIPND